MEREDRKCSYEQDKKAFKEFLHLYFSAINYGLIIMFTYILVVYLPYVL